MIIFGANNFSCRFPLDKNNYFLVLRSFSEHFIEDKTANAEAKFETNFMQPNKKFRLSLHYSGIYSCLYDNGKQVHNFSAEGNLPKVYIRIETVASNFDDDEQKQVSFNESVHVFSINHWQRNQDEIETYWWNNTISDECIKINETKKLVEVTEFMSSHFPFAKIY